MILNKKIKKYIDDCVLCWLATSSIENIPNVSPKEIFTYFKKEIIVANIASPQTVKNIRQNPNVCISFIHIFIQKGYQIKGKASIIDKSYSDYETKETKLLKMTKGKFPFATITNIQVDSIKEILAPSYQLFSQTTEKNQIKNAQQAYQKILNKVEGFNKESSYQN